LVRFPEPAQMLGEAEPDGLTDLVRVRLGEPMGAHHRPDQGAEPLHDRLPGRRVPVGGGLDQRADISTVHGPTPRVRHVIVRRGGERSGPHGRADGCTTGAGRQVGGSSAGTRAPRTSANSVTASSSCRRALRGSVSACAVMCAAISPATTGVAKEVPLHWASPSNITWSGLAEPFSSLSTPV